MLAAILVIGGPAWSSASGGKPGGLLPGNQEEMLAGVPVALLEVLGKSAAQRCIDRLQGWGLGSVTVVIGETRSTGDIRARENLGLEVVHPTEGIWSRTGRVVRQYANCAVDVLLLVRLGAYVELDVDRLISFHRDRGRGITRVCDSSGPLDFWVMDGTWLRRRQEQTTDPRVFLADRTSRFVTNGYVNRLTGPADLRRFATDVLLLRCASRPGGRQVRPGVWLDEGAIVDKSARLVAPAYIGRETRLRPSVLVTRLSHVESYCDVDFGTAIEDSSILTNTYVGPSLDVTHAVVQGGHVVHLNRNVAVEIRDPLLMGRTAVRGDESGQAKHHALAARMMERAIQLS